MTATNNGYRQYELDNGLVVALQNTPTQTVAGKLRVNFGSMHERSGEEGMAHFLEHCLSSGGSKKYNPTTADETRDSFGFYKVATNVGKTFFIGKVLSEGLENWLEYVSDHALNPRLDEERVNGERGRVLREISDFKSTPSYSASKEFNKILYRGHPRGIFIPGKEDVVKNASLAQIADFHSRGFHPNNMEIILTGGLPENIEEIVDHYFGVMPRGNNTVKDFPEIKPLSGKKFIYRTAAEKYNIDNPQESSAQLILASIFPSESRLDNYAIKIMSAIFGEGTNSLLFKNMELKKGLAYSVNTSYSGDYNCEEWRVGAQVPANRIDESINTLFEEIERMKTHKVSDAAVNTLKKRARYDLAEAFESNKGLISAIELKLDTGFTPESYMEGFNKVTPEKIQEVASKYLPSKDNGNYLLYIADPLKDRVA